MNQTIPSFVTSVDGNDEMFVVAGQSGVEGGVVQAGHEQDLFQDRSAGSVGGRERPQTHGSHDRVPGILSRYSCQKVSHSLKAHSK